MLTVTPRVNTRHVPTARLLLAVLAASASLAAAVRARAQSGPPALEPPAVCVGSQASATSEDVSRERKSRFDADSFVRTELFFGSERPDLPEVSPEEFKSFLDAVVTP